MKNYLKESLLSLLCFIIHGQGSSENGFKILNYETEIYLIALVSCLHGRNWNRKGFFAANIKYFVCFNTFYTGKGFCDIFRSNERPKIKLFNDL